MRRLIVLVAASLAKADKLPAGSSYLPPTAASNGYGAPQASYGGGNDDYYDDYEEDQQPSYSEDQVGHILPKEFEISIKIIDSSFLKTRAHIILELCNSLLSRFFLHDAFFRAL